MTVTNGKPEGYTTLTPFLVCSPAAEATHPVSPAALPTRPAGAPPLRG